MGEGRFASLLGQELCSRHRPTGTHNYTTSASYCTVSNSLPDDHSAIGSILFSDNERRNECRFTLGLNTVISNLYTSSTELILSILLIVAYCKLIMGTNVSYKLTVSVLMKQCSAKGEILFYGHILITMLQ